MITFIICGPQWLQRIVPQGDHLIMSMAKMISLVFGGPHITVGCHIIRKRCSFTIHYTIRSGREAFLTSLEWLNLVDLIPIINFSHRIIALCTVYFSYFCHCNTAPVRHIHPRFARISITLGAKVLFLYELNSSDTEWQISNHHIIVPFDTNISYLHSENTPKSTGDHDHITFLRNLSRAASSCS